MTGASLLGFGASVGCPTHSPRRKWTNHFCRPLCSGRNGKRVSVGGLPEFTCLERQKRDRASARRYELNEDSLRTNHLDNRPEEPLAQSSLGTIDRENYGFELGERHGALTPGMR